MVHIIVTGSRTATSDEAWSFIFRTLGAGVTNTQSLTHGFAPGVDTIAGEWATAQSIKVHEFPANWAPRPGKNEKYNRSAGPERNNFMLRETIKRCGAENIVVLGFTDKPLEQSRGTSQCLQEAGRRGLTTHHFRTDLETREF